MAKLSQIDQFRLIASAINRTSRDMQWPNFRRVFTVVLEGHQKLIIEIAENGRCWYVPQEVVEDAVLQYLEAFVSQYGSTPKKVKEAVKYWLMCSPGSTEKPAAFKWQDEGGCAFSIIPFDRVVVLDDVFETPEKHFPTWYSILQRMENSDAFVEFIGCILNGKKLQSYLWVNGIGQDGKGSMSRCLARAFGDAYTATNAPEKSEKRFWAAQLLGKTIVAFNDCNENSFIRTSLFKQLSGGDAIRIDEKNQKAFMAQLQPYFIFFSNFDPRISSSRADLRRLIHCPLAPVPKDKQITEFEQKLWAEMGSFLRFCDQHYTNNIGRLHFAPEISAEEASNLAEENEDKFDGYMHNCFEFDPESNITQGHFYYICKQVIKLNDYEIGEFKQWLKTKHNMKTVRPTSNGPRIWRGLKSIV